MAGRVASCPLKWRELDLSQDLPYGETKNAPLAHPSPPVVNLVVVFDADTIQSI